MNIKNMKSDFSRLTDSGGVIGVRHIQTFFMFMNVTIAYFTRISTSLALIAMTNKNSTNPDFDEFSWSISEQSLILSSFYWGYAPMQLPAGWFEHKYGPKTLFLTSTFSASILGTITPTAIRTGGWQAFCSIRILQGVAQGFIFPTMHSFLAKWSPVHERNRLGAISMSGVEVGTILAFIASGNIAGSNIGWPGIYYVSAGLGFLWAVLWFFFGSSSPCECKYITEEEQNFIEASVHSHKDNPTVALAVPWRYICLSIPFLALIVTRMGQAWGFSTLLNEIPKYMSGVMDMHIQENALYSGLPYISMLVVCYLSIAIADYLTSKKNVSLSIIRKSFNSVAFWVPGCTLVGLTFVTKDQTVLAVVLMIATVGSNGMHTIGSCLNHIDLSPNYAGILMGITNTAENIVGLIAPLGFSAIVTDKTNLEEWRIVFWTAAGIYIVSNLAFLGFGQTVLQTWNDPELKNDIETQMKTEQSCENKVMEQKQEQQNFNSNI